MGIYLVVNVQFHRQNIGRIAVHLFANTYRNDHDSVGRFSAISVVLFRLTPLADRELRITNRYWGVHSKGGVSSGVGLVK